MIDNYSKIEKSKTTFLKIFLEHFFFKLINSRFPQLRSIVVKSMPSFWLRRYICLSILSTWTWLCFVIILHRLREKFTSHFLCCSTVTVTCSMQKKNRFKYKNALSFITNLIMTLWYYRFLLHLCRQQFISCFVRLSTAAFTDIR